LGINRDCARVPRWWSGTGRSRDQRYDKRSSRRDVTSAARSDGTGVPWNPIVTFPLSKRVRAVTAHLRPGDRAKWLARLRPRLWTLCACASRAVSPAVPRSGDPSVRQLPCSAAVTRVPFSVIRIKYNNNIRTICVQICC